MIIYYPIMLYWKPDCKISIQDSKVGVFAQQHHIVIRIVHSKVNYLMVIYSSSDLMEFKKGGIITFFVLFVFRFMS